MFIFNLICSMKFLSPEPSVLNISISLPYGLAWNSVVMFGLEILAATWICQMSNRNGYVRLLVQLLLPLLNTWLIVEIWPSYVFFIGITLVDVHLNWVDSGGRSTRYSNMLHDFSCHHF